ncbi:hypothetical protein EPUL_004676 [Erysiphe pulchra]|uniref:Uncharacterized protein n=1 Tax=Erysiphe pulchra TaxID=225359 RepID=A0A2S4PN33_9PEZI|nr:hypothetical protein EPUL_004676 [Erysiphe pulchra]
MLHILYFTDRRYHQNTGARINKHHSISKKPKQRCYICQNESCRSCNHTEQERWACRTKIRNMVNSRLNPRPFNNKHFQERFRQYTLDCEFNDPIDDKIQEEELNKVLNSLVLDINEGLDESLSDKEQHHTATNYTSYGEIDLQNAV